VRAGGDEEKQGKKQMSHEKLPEIIGARPVREIVPAAGRAMVVKKKGKPKLPPNLLVKQRMKVH